MKLFRNLVESVIVCLEEIIPGNRYSDKVLEKAFKQRPQWGARDRRFVAEAVYDIVRNYRYLSAVAGTEKNFRLILAAYLFDKGLELPDWADYQTINTKLFEAARDKISSKAVLLSYPDWMWELGENELGGEAWLREAEAMNQPARVVLRVNTLKTSKAALRQKLADAQIETEEAEGFDDALLLVKRQNIFSSPLFKEGFFEVQDAGSQLIAGFLQAEPGQKVIDACAGGGGKSLHLAALMKNKGRIIAMDVEAWKLENLKKRARRAGAFNIETRLIDSNTIGDLRNSADRLLLDVPCSGLGVIRRNPDAKWKLSPEVIERTRQLQQDLLNNYSAMLRPGGLMGYSTCSILPSENQQQVQKFLEANRGQFTLVKEKNLLPSQGFDGFYMALLSRSNA